MTERVTITLPDDLVAEIDELARTSGRSRSSVVREASASWVAGAHSRAAETRRKHAVAETLEYLDELAELPVQDERAVEDILREVRGPLGAAPPGDSRVGPGRA